MALIITLLLIGAIVVWVDNLVKKDRQRTRYTRSAKRRGIV